MFINLALIFLLVSISFYYHITRTFNYWKKRNVKHPKPVPLFGNIKESALNRKHYFEILKEIYDQHPDEKVVGIYRMTTPCLLLRDLDVIKQIWIKDFDKFVDRGISFSKEGLGTNLVHADGDTWKILRKKFTPIFTSGKLKNMLHLLIEIGDKFMEYVCEKNENQQEVEITSLMQRFFMASVSACTFGFEVDLNSKEQMTQLQEIDKFIFKKTFLHELDMMYPGILLKTNFSLFPNVVTKFFHGIAKLVLSQRNGIPSNRRDFIDLILEMKKEGMIQSSNADEYDKTFGLEVSDSLIAAQAFVFYGAGYETTTTAMVCMFFLLAKHQDIQEKLHEEIDQVLKKYNGELTYDAICEMTYLEKVFYETLRMYAVADNILRKAAKEYQIPGTDVVIAKGQTVIVSGYGIHYDEKYYPDPEKFDPERFSLEKVRDRHQCAMMAFGVGPRNCIGMRFSKMTSAVCVVKLLSKFRVQLSTNTPAKIKYLPSRFLMFPEGGVPLALVPKVR